MPADPGAAAFMGAFHPRSVPVDRPPSATTARVALLQATVGIVLPPGAVRRRSAAVSGTVPVGLGVRTAARGR
ncbi:hypothetical protein [Nocardiopsis sp. CC223A]|uniref:hypothetical protein n=1 Tax=Nocardiopsis sp. CC223A TaxID=3044051 RepID=UPI00278C48F1|nr:hypothetical protein [Nocardiopsis sp. CC223A]